MPVSKEQVALLKLGWPRWWVVKTFPENPCSTISRVLPTFSLKRQW